jgi:hypothetical protein
MPHDNAANLEGSEGVFCRVRVDRVQAGARSGSSHLPEFPQFECLRNSFVRSQTPFRTYQRVSTYRNDRTKTKLFVQHACIPPWLPPCKVTAIGSDDDGLQRSELESVLGAFGDYQLLMVEIAFDFSPELGLDADSVRRRVLCGKSQLRLEGERCGEAHFGTRKSEKYVRCYFKLEVDAFRIELELHSGWLKKHNIRTLEDVHRIATLISPIHLQFVRLDWGALNQSLSRRGFPAVARELRSRNFDIRSVLRRLSTNFGVQNVHRFRRGLELNILVRKSLRVWARKWVSIGNRQTSGSGFEGSSRE